MAFTIKPTKYCFNLPSIGIKEKHFNILPWGRQVEYLQKIETWKQYSKKIHISQKSRSTAKAIKEFKDLYRPTEYFFVDRETANYRDDSIEIWYRN